mgnify:CR=1 FL=1
MSDLSARHRALLAETYEVGLTAPEKVSISTDGTKKYLYRTSQNHFIESAYIPDGDRATLCISSQAGCRMGCRFCATGRQGLQHSLSTNEILNQIGSLPERERLTNVVSWAWANRSTTWTVCCRRSKSSLRRGDSAGRPHESQFRPPV